MGQEIVYCFKCQKRILGTEISKGLAYQVENQMCCSTCVVLVLDTLPAKAKEQLLAKMYQANEARQNTTTGSMRVLSGAPSQSSTGRIPTLAPRSARADGDGSSLPMIVGIGAALLAILVATFGFSGGSSPTPAPPPAKVIKLPPPPPPPPPPETGPSPDEKRRADAAAVAMKKARDFAASNSRDFEGQAKQWRAALAEAERTGYEAEARRELEKTEARAKEALGKQMAELDQQVRAPLARRDFKAAQELLDQARPRRSDADWVALLNRLQTEIQDGATRAFAELKDKALAARDRGAKADVDAIKATVAKWGLPFYVAELDTALEVAWRRLFDGKSAASFINPACLGDWTVVDGALTHVPGQEAQAGQSKESYGDGELRFRFTVEKSESMFIAVRQGGGAVRATFHRPAVEAMGPGEHEILFTCRGAQVSATLDGKPLKLELQGKEPLPTGRIQFNSSTGVIRFLAVEYRP